MKPRRIGNARAQRGLTRRTLFALLLLTLAGTFGCAREERLNVLLLTLDTTRADHIGCYGHEAIETPAIDRLAAEGTRYDNAFSAVPITLPSHLAMMSGTHPSFHGVRENAGFYVPDEIDTLAEILQSEGYDTAAFVGAFPLDSQTGLDQGFDLYDDNYPSRDGRHHRLRRFFDERPASDVASVTTSWLDDHGDRPFFAWAHFFDAHQPFIAPSPYRERYRNAPYDAEIAFVDDAIARIVEALEERDLLDRTLIVLTADHGEGLGEHGEATHALLLYSTTLRVPLIVRDPQRAGDAVIEAPVSTVDIFSTILTRLGVAVPEANQGVPLPLTESEAAPERAILSETLFGRLIYGWSPIYRVTKGSKVHIHGPSQHLYDRASDPGELVNVAASEPESLEELQREVRRERRERAEGGYGFAAGKATDNALARLAALGYIGTVRATEEDLSDDVDPSRADPIESMEIFDLQNEGSSLNDAGRFELAIPILERARALDPENPAVMMSLVQARMGFRDREGAREAIERLLELSPDHVSTRVLLAEYHHDRGELEAAVANMERAVEVDPEDLATRLRLAFLLEDIGRTEDAEATYRGSLERDEGDVASANGLATLLARRGDSGAAAELLRQAVRVQPYFAPAYLNLAVIESGRGRADEARRLAERALLLRPGYPQATELLGRLERGDEATD